MAAILNFRIFRKIAKHKNAYISKTVLDRAISMKFLTHRVSPQSSHANFQKKFILPKMAAILNFCAKIAKHKNANISKTMLHRTISMKFLIFRVSLQSSYPKELSLANANYVHPTGGWTYYFFFFRRLPSAVRRPTWFPDILGNSSYPIFTKFGMQVYWVNSLYGIAFGDDSSIAN